MSGPSRNLFVAGLAPHITDAVFHALFAPFGTILSAKVMLDIHTGRSRGFGFVLFERLEDAEAAMASLSETVVEHSRLHISASPHTGENLLIKLPNIYVRNVPRELSDAEVRAHFSAYGPINTLTSRQDTAKGSTGDTNVIYIEFTRYNDALRAVQSTHGNRIFECCHVPLLAKMAEPPHLRSERRARFRPQQQQQQQHQQAHTTVISSSSSSSEIILTTSTSAATANAPTSCSSPLHAPTTTTTTSGPPTSTAGVAQTLISADPVPQSYLYSPQYPPPQQYSQPHGYPPPQPYHLAAQQPPLPYHTTTTSALISSASPLSSSAVSSMTASATAMPPQQQQQHSQPPQQSLPSLATFVPRPMPSLPPSLISSPSPHPHPHLTQHHAQWVSYPQQHHSSQQFHSNPHSLHPQHPQHPHQQQVIYWGSPLPVPPHTTTTAITPPVVYPSSTAGPMVLYSSYPPTHPPPSAHHLSFFHP